MNLSHLNLSEDAERLALLVWELIQFFDDVFDKESVTDANVYSSVCNTFLYLPANQFYQKHFAAIYPCLMLAIVKWKLANEMEATKQGDARSYMWRAAYYDFLATVCILDGKPCEISLLTYGEKLEDYLQEVNNA